MAFALRIPTKASPLEVDIRAGEAVFLLGANGAGKSGLIRLIFSTHAKSARRVSAHRQTWFTTGPVSITGEQRKNVGANISALDTSDAARWLEHSSDERTKMAVYDLVDAENCRARGIAAAVDKGDMARANELRRQDAPIKIINDLMREANLPIVISLRENDEIVAKRDGGEPYSIAELSDGERNALLLAANVLTSPSGTLLLVDEPERHLHRSIASPLLAGLFKCRPDCAFVISTHDIGLVTDNPNSRAILVRRSYYVGKTAQAWDVDLTSVDRIDEDLRVDILGARRTMLFVEGTETSLDKPLYALVFPNVSVVPKASCRDVEHAVLGIRDSSELHWVRAYGIIDNDGRRPEDIEYLKVKGVHGLPVFSVESIYFDSDIQRRIAARQASVTGEDAAVRLAEARTAALAAIDLNKKRLAERVAEKVVRELFLSQIPKREHMVAAQPVVVSIDVASAIREEEGRIHGLIANKDLDALIRRYPVRETPALAEIASRLGFRRRETYESAVRKLLRDDSDALTHVRSYFGSLCSELDG